MNRLTLWRSWGAFAPHCAFFSIIYPWRAHCEAPKFYDFSWFMRVYLPPSSPSCTLENFEDFWSLYITGLGGAYAPHVFKYSHIEFYCLFYFISFHLLYFNDLFNQFEYLQDVLTVQAGRWRPVMLRPVMLTDLIKHSNSLQYDRLRSPDVYWSILSINLSVLINY